jgi:glucosyl-3-phosphoglycerate synthase
MARQLLGTVLSRCGLVDGSGELTQFVQVAGEWLPDTSSVDVTDRPPMRELLVR